ncbi:hypothetical protein XAP6164_1490019 [Xanthomonas phaseoli pv. phaseoli]|nr:hypothetical protein XAP6164_1490019 [Xanthomonas phaseoli pv. phaseoli]
MRDDLELPLSRCPNDLHAVASANLLRRAFTHGCIAPALPGGGFSLFLIRCHDSAPNSGALARQLLNLAWPASSTFPTL